MGAQRAGTVTDGLRSARDLLLEQRNDLEAARVGFSWPRFEHLNWALDWFDAVARRPETAGRDALVVVEQDGAVQRRTYAELSRRSGQVANWLRSLGVRRHDRVLLMLGNQVELWEALLAAIKLGAVVVPATTLLTTEDLRDRVERGALSCVVARGEDTAKFADIHGDFGRIAVAGGATGDAGSPAGWTDYAESLQAVETFEPDGPTPADDPMLLYFTSGTTAKPKLVLHTHQSYPVGHLSTMYWIGLQPGDLHCNISSPGWAKHAWSSLFAPFDAEATVFVHNPGRFSAPLLLDVLADHAVSTLCAPPTVWRMLVQQDLAAWQVALREVVAAGEPLNPEVIEVVRRAWGLTVRDGYGQTETTAQIGNPPGAPLVPGSMGRPLPGYEVELLDVRTGEPATEGEIVLPAADRPLGLMQGYVRAIDSGRSGSATVVEDPVADGWYHTGDVARRDEQGYITFVGRTDDVFKCSDYRISPFELESVLLEHPAVAEAAVVPSPDPMLLGVPKAYVVLAEGWAPDEATAREVLGFTRSRLSPFKRVRRIEFAELPKTISGKIRRAELRAREDERLRDGPAPRAEHEWWEEDLATH
jgi:acetyl-CoA synthetase